MNDFEMRKLREEAGRLLDKGLANESAAASLIVIAEVLRQWWNEERPT